MAYQERLTNFTIETETGDLFVFEFRDLNVKREDQVGIFNFQNDIPFANKIQHGAERHQYELYLSGEDYDIAAANFWEATKSRNPITLKYPSRDKAVNAQLISIEQINNHASGEGEVIFVIDVLESSILEKASEDTTRQSYIAQQYQVVQQANSKYYYQDIPTTPSALEKAKKAMETATAAVNKALSAYDVATDALADLKSIERTASGLIDTLDTNAELFSQAFQGFIELSISAIPVEEINNFIDMVINLIDIFNQDTDDNSKLMLSVSLTGGLILAATQTTADVYGNKLEVYQRGQAVFDFYENVVAIADTLEIDSDFIILLNDLINLTAAKLEQISFQAKQERIYVTDKVEEIYTLVYRLIPCENSDQLEEEVERFIKANKIGGELLFEIPIGKKLKYYL